MGTISNRVLISACYGGEDRAAASWRWFHRWIFRPGSYGLGAVCLDFDSTVVTRNGQQQGACRGYNPARSGRASHHPLLAFIADFCLIANFWLCPGNAHSANNVLQFLESTLAHLAGKTVGLLRADSGFFDDAFLSALEFKHIPYVVAAKEASLVLRPVGQCLRPAMRANMN